MYEMKYNVYDAWTNEIVGTINERGLEKFKRVVNEIYISRAKKGLNVPKGIPGKILGFRDVDYIYVGGKA